MVKTNSTTAVATFEAEETVGYDGAMRFRRLWRHPAPRGGILYIHGITSHGAWYEHTLSQISDAGYTVLLPDRVGSGRSGGERGEIGDPGEWVADYRFWFDTLRQTCPDLPLFIVGACFGARIAVPLAVEAPTGLAGLVLTTPAYFVKVPVVVGDRDQEAARNALQGLGHARIGLPFPAEYFTDTPDWAEFIRRDSLQLREGSTNLLIAISRMHEELPGLAPRIQVPILLFLADDDRMLDNPRVEELFDRAFPHDRLTRVHLPGYRHIPDFEPDPSRYLNELERWLSGLTS